MKNFDNDLELIENYLEDKLDESKRNEVKTRIAEDADFNMMYLKTKGIIQLVKKEAEEDTLSMIREIAAAQKKGRLRLIRNVTAIAASVVILLTAGLWVFKPFNSDSTDLFAQYYTTPSFDVSRGQTSEEDIQAIANAFNEQNYQEAISLLQQEESPSTQLQIYEGIALLENNQTDQALELFSALANGQEQLDQILWYKALAEIKADQAEAAKASLNQLLNGNITVTAKRKNQATELLDKL